MQAIKAFARFIPRLGKVKNDSSSILAASYSTLRNIPEVNPSTNVTARIQPLYVITACFSTIQNISKNKLLAPRLPTLNFVCGMKVRGKVKRRCRHCFLVMRDERWYNICKVHPRHKQMQLKPKPKNTWILTHASQSKVRPW